MAVTTETVVVEEGRCNEAAINVVALDSATGQRRWQHAAVADGDLGNGWRRVVVREAQQQLIGIDVKSGSVLWTTNRRTGAEPRHWWMGSIRRTRRLAGIRDRIPVCTSFLGVGDVCDTVEIPSSSLVTLTQHPMPCGAIGRKSFSVMAAGIRD